MNWDIFCRVIDNHGDIGVCWRLACQLAARGEQVRLWVDDGSALQWMAPNGCQGVSVINWSDPEAIYAATEARAPDVLVEAFGCDPHAGLVMRFAAHVEAGHSGRWINLEYLSAEPYVERMHQLPSSVFHEPGAGLTKYFFYPGFTHATGGLLRETDLAARRASFDRSDWLARQGIHWRGERVISLFCYEPETLGHLMRQWAEGPVPTLLLVTAGRAANAVAAALALLRAANDLAAAQDMRQQIGVLSIVYLPLMSQPAFDELLWACDLNFVRGEDSLVRALWAGQPFVWQIYPQDDDAHHAKLDALLTVVQAPASLRAFHAAWNGSTSTVPLAPVEETLRTWAAAARAARTRLAGQQDLVTQLIRFAAPEFEHPPTP